MLSQGSGIAEATPLPPQLTSALLAASNHGQAGPPSPPGFKAQPTGRKADVARLAVTHKAATEEIPLLAGYNLISIPEEPADASPAAVFAAIAPQLEKVEAYDACDPVDPWKLYDPTDPAASDLTLTDHEIGMWVKTTAAAVLPSDGTLPTSTTLQLCVGWNLIGFPAGQARHPLAVLAPIAGKWQRLFGYDAFDPVDPWEVYDPNVPAWANDLTVMQPGRGYWLLVTEATTLDIDNHGAPPHVEIHAPADGASVTTFTDVVATVRSSLLESWTLTVRGLDDPQPSVLAMGTTPAELAPIANFDPTLLLNGVYELGLAATDFAGQSASTAVDVVVEGGLKLGNFTLPFLDLELPVLGVELQVVRTYDSRDKRPGDFGVGWRLGLSEVQLQENVPPGRFWQGTVSPGAFPTYCILPTRAHIITIVLPGDEVFRFQPTVTPECQTIAPQQVVTLSYEPVGITRGQLIPLDQELESLVVGSFPGPIELWDQLATDIHDAETYQLTTGDGRVLVIHDQDGLRTITDANGNVLSVTETGIEHSGGLDIDFQRDGQGRISQISDPMGNAMIYTYDANGDLESVLDQAGELTRFTYLPDHYLHKIILDDGEEILAAEYDGDGRLIRNCQKTSCLSRRHDVGANQEVWTDATGRESIMTYDTRGNVTALTETGPGGASRTTQFEYNAFGQITRKVGPAGGETVLVYDSGGRLTSSRDPMPAGADPADYTTTYTYDAAGRIRTGTYPDGRAYTASYDAAGNLTEIRDEQNRLLQGRTYGAGGAVLTETDGFGTYTYSGHHASGEPGTIIDPEGGMLSSQYDNNGWLTQLQVDSEPPMTLAYDGRGRTTQIQDPRGTITYDYGDRTDQWTTFDSPTTGTLRRMKDDLNRFQGMEIRGRVQNSYEYDAAGRATVDHGAMGRDTRYAYDDFGQVERITAANNGETRFERDPAGRVTEMFDALGQQASFSFRLDGSLESYIDKRRNTWLFTETNSSKSVTDPLNRTTTIEFNKDDDARKTIFPDNTERTVLYLQNTALGEEGLLVDQIIDEGGNTRSFGYDAIGRLTSVTDLAGVPYTLDRVGETGTLTTPNGETVTFDSSADFYTLRYDDGGVTRFDFDLSQQQTSRITKASTATLDFAYDAFGRRTSRTDSATGEVHTFGWNDADELTSSTSALGTTTYAYDTFGNLSTHQAPTGDTARFGRDLLGQVTNVELTPGSAGASARDVLYRHDANGNLIEVEDPVTGITTFDYDLANRLTLRTLPNGIETGFTYNLRDQVTEIVHRTAGGSVIASFTYQREGLGEPTRITREDGSYALYEYDDALRLTRESYYDSGDTLLDDVAYTYDGSGNRLTRTDGAGTATYGYAPGFQLTGVTGARTESYQYDADGNLASIDRNGRSLTLGYSTGGKLTSAAEAGGDTVTYAYDARSRRVRATDAGGERRLLSAPILGGGLPATQMVTDTAGNLVTGYVYAGNQPLMRYGAGGETFYLTDAMGSVVAMVDAAGNIVGRIDYDAFGEIRAETGDTAAPAGAGGDFRFHGAWRDAATGFDHYPERDYDSVTGRFLTRDPFGPELKTPESANIYLFANANPLLFRDPTGLFSIVSVNVSMSVQSIVSAIKTAALHQIRQQVREEVIDFSSRIVLRILANYMPMDLAGLVLAIGEGIIEDKNPFWKAVERGVQSGICFLLQRSPWLYFEPGIWRRNARITSDGFGCPVRKSSGVGHRPEHRYPDFYISTAPPSLNGGRGAPKVGLITGEIKASIRSFYHAWIARTSGHYWNPSQYEVFARHASTQTYPRMMVLVAFNDGSDAMKTRIATDMMARGVVGFIIALK